MDFDCLVFIGRFQPFHAGHVYVVEEALKRAKTVLILIGSANSPRTIKNPFSFDEREAMILEAFRAQAERIICMPLDDTLYNDHKWLQNVGAAVQFVLADDANAKVGIIGHTKDDSSYYLSLFPDWGFLELPNFQAISATPLRKAYFSQGMLDEQWQEVLPVASQVFLDKFRHTSDFASLQQAYQHIASFRAAWQDAPYPPVFVTTDALVVQSGHILLIERGGEYGQGLWALPGGFLDQQETLLECAIRELAEETGLKVAPSSLKQSQTFDAPSRSARGRTVTTVFYFELVGDALPPVHGADDAKRAFWLPLHQLDGHYFFEDHYSIITKMLGL